MADMCTDNRFKLIEKYKKALIDSTNIESAQDETAVYYNIIGYDRILSDKEERDYSLDWLGGVHEWRYK